MSHMDLKRTRQLMNQKGIDALVASTVDNCYYASGVKPSLDIALPMGTIMHVDPADQPTVIICDFLEMQAKRMSSSDDIRTYPIWMPIATQEDLTRGVEKPKERPQQFNVEDAFGIFSDVFREKAVDKGVVGIEGNLLKNPEIYAILTKQNPKAKFVEADGLFWELRKVKTEEEIKTIRIAVDLALKGFQAAKQGGFLGATIGDIKLKYQRGVLQAASPDNAADLRNLRINVSSGDHFRTLDDPGYRIAKDDVVFTDFGLHLHGYASDIGRTFCCGRPGEMQEKLFGAIREGFEEATSKVKPGVRMKEIYKALQEPVIKRGYPWYLRGHMGHSIGIGPVEQPPFISPGEETQLEPNMIICVECGAYVVGRFGAFQIEDMLLVTSEGHEVLTPLPRDMIEP